MMHESADHVNRDSRPARARCCSSSTLGQFTQSLLAVASGGLPVVTARVDRFIAEGGKYPYRDME
jgi:hypothetical protein